MKHCTKCGKELADHARFCSGCGCAQDAQPAQTAYQPGGYQDRTVYAAPSQPAQPPQPRQQQYVPPRNQVSPNPFKGSDWDGTVFDTFVNSLGASLIILLTCGIATPWAICFMMKFVIGHATIDGKRLVFEGTGGSLFGNWIKWFLLTIITCGIYGFWVYPRLYKWVASNIHFAN